MKRPTTLCAGFFLAVGLTAPLPAQDLPVPTEEQISENYPASSPAELDALLGPIALYPDDLVALILPAATETTDIVLAARYLDAGGSLERIDQQPWDESVRAVAHFPEVVTMMNEDLGWTQHVGDEFLLQPAEVMKSIQRLRAKAYAAGTLQDTPQQKVLVDGDVIRIVPAVENVIYVPRYETEVVYVDRPVYRSSPWISFGVGWHIGSWHRWDCDWYNHRVWVFQTHRHWRDHRWFHRHHHHHDRHYRHGWAWNPPPRHRHYHRDRDWSDRRDRDRHDRPGRRYVDRDRDRDHDRGRRWNRSTDRSRPSNPTEVVTRRVIENERRADRVRTRTPNVERNSGSDNRGRNFRNGDLIRNDGSNRNRNNGGAQQREIRSQRANSPTTVVARQAAPVISPRTVNVAPARERSRPRNDTVRTQVTRSRPDVVRSQASSRRAEVNSSPRRNPTANVAAAVRNAQQSNARAPQVRAENRGGSGRNQASVQRSNGGGGGGRSSHAHQGGRSRGSDGGDKNSRSDSSRSGR